MVTTRYSRPGGRLEPGGLRREVEDALEHRAVPAALVDRARDVEGQGVQAGQDAGLLEVVERRSRARRRRRRSGSAPVQVKNLVRLIFTAPR